MTRRCIPVVIGLLLTTQLCASSSALAAGGGLPIPAAAYGLDGVTTPGGADRYVAVPSGERTVVARVEQDGGNLLRARSFKERLAIPAVTLQGSPGGLSADGKTLVLASANWGLRRSETSFEVLHAPRVRLREHVTLRGNFTFDAISPDGSRIYLIEYKSRTDPTRYAVRAYDVEEGRLLRAPILDPEEPPGEMRGHPMARVTSPDGRWAYTLYDGGGDHPFIHALDTAEGRAVCIDLHALAGVKNFYRFSLATAADGSELRVVDRNHGPTALVDTQTFAVSGPPTPETGFPWPLVAVVPIALVAAWALTTLARRRRHIAPREAR